MSLRRTLIPLLAFVLMCAGALFAFQSFLSRDAEMRAAEIAFRNRQIEQMGDVPLRQSVQARHAKRKREAASSGDKPLTLDDWYAETGAGAAGEQTPAGSEFQTDTTPLVSADPVG